MFFRLHVCLVVVFFISSNECVSFVSDKRADRQLQVATTKGVVQGQRAVTYTGRQYWSFTGIPYAKPPVENLRFRPPKSAVPWQGVLDATNESPNCVETFMRASGFFSGGNEDCLYVNVFTPQDPKAIERYLPVMVWIHGGAFMEGNSSTKYFGPDHLLLEDVVVVTFNYRVGLFGFLSTGDVASPGNYGLKDQNLLLRWVQANIKNFGGDRNLVTIFGESAGAASAFYHLVSTKSRGLFHRAIANSGSSICTFAYKRDARATTFQIAGALGISTKSTKEAVAQMRKADLSRLREISTTLLSLSALTSTIDGFPFLPVIEPDHKDAFVSDSTYTLMKKGDFNRVPVLTGFNSLEAIFFIKLIRTLKPFTIIFNLSPSSFVNPSMNVRTTQERREAGLQIQRHYFQSGSFFDSTDDEALNYVSDDQFVRPIRKTVQLIWRYVPVYLYLFDYRSDYGLKGFEDDLKGMNGVSHGEELPFIWKGEGRSAPRNLDRLMVMRMVKFYTNFARTGNPTPARDDLFKNIIWPQVNSSSAVPYLKIDAHLSVGQNYRDEHMRFWDKIYDSYGHEPYYTY